MAASTETMADEQRSPSRSSNQLMRNVAFAHQWAAQRQLSLVRVRVAIVDASRGARACAPTSRRSSGSSSLTCAVTSGLCHTSGSPICWTYTMRAASLHGCEAGSRPHDGDGSQQHRPPSRRGPWPHSGGLELPRLVSRLWDFSAPAESQTGANPAQSKGIRDESADSNPPICGPFRALCAMTGVLRIVVSPVRVRVSRSQEIPASRLLCRKAGPQKWVATRHGSAQSPKRSPNGHGP